MPIYGYGRISTPAQNIDRQIRNIKAAYPEAVIVTDTYTGTKDTRPGWQRLMHTIKPGDILIFDSVSRMSRNAAEGFNAYEQLYSAGITLVFLKEPGIDTTVYQSALKSAVPLTGTNVDLILQGVNAFLLELAKEQIRLAFDQAEKEVSDLHQRTREGMETARLNGKQIGQVKGRKLHTKKSDPAKEIIRKHSRAFGGSLSDDDCRKLAGISRNTYYKYKSELKGEITNE